MVNIGTFHSFGQNLAARNRKSISASSRRLYRFSCTLCEIILSIYLRALPGCVPGVLYICCSDVRAESRGCGGVDSTRPFACKPPSHLAGKYLISYMWSVECRASHFIALSVCLVGWSLSIRRKHRRTRMHNEDERERERADAIVRQSQ